MLITWFVLAGLILIVMPRKVTGKFQSAFNTIFKIPLSIGHDFSLSVSQKQYTGDMVSRKEYVQLENHSRNQEQELTEAYAKLEKLYGLYNKYVWPDRQFVLSGVYKVTTAGTINECVIDRGEKNGLKAGQYVLGDNSIIGVVSDVFAGNAKVKLVSDTSFQAAVQMGNMKTVMRGGGNGICKITQFSRKHKVRIGDDVFICKKAGVLGAAIKVGKVTACKINEENPLFWDVTIKPACDIEQLDDAAVIIMGTVK